jgi:hypothetical protein
MSYILSFNMCQGNTPIKILWNITLNNIELVAGMLAGGIGIMEDLNRSLSDNKITYCFDSSTDVSSFRKSNNISEDDILYNTYNTLIPGQYGIWLKGSKRFYYNYYIFQTNKFFQGIISICNAFGVDFRDYIYGFPFDVKGNKYALGGYAMTSSQVGLDVPDLDDVEEENRDNENAIELLHKDY